MTCDFQFLVNTMSCAVAGWAVVTAYARKDTIRRVDALETKLAGLLDMIILLDPARAKERQP